MISNKVGFKNFYSLFTIAGTLLLSTAFLVPQKASAQAAVPAYVPVKDAELISAFKIFLGSAGGGTYTGTDGNPVEIAATVCATTTLPGGPITDEEGKTQWYSGNQGYFNYDANGDGVGDPSFYKKGYHQNPKTGEWEEYKYKQGGDVYYTTRSIDRPGPADPDATDYYKDPENAYFFLPNPDEMTDNGGINSSMSLNCLLKEQISWQKLQINMQMHSMIKEYFTDAQTYALSQQLLSTLAAATIEWSNNGLKQTYYIDGVATTTSGSVYDYPNETGIASNNLQAIIDAVNGGIIGTDDLEVGANAEYKDYISKTMIANLSPTSEDSYITALKNKVAYVPLKAGSTQADAYANAMRNSALNVSGILESATAQKMTEAADKQKSQWEAYGGYLSVTDCGDDPFCRNPKIVTPGNILGQNLYQATQSGNNALGTINKSGQAISKSSQELSYQLQQTSLADYDIKQLLSNEQTPQELFDEFEFVLTNYYGLDKGTTNFSRNMLINTWDDLMWESGAPRKAAALGKQLDEIKASIATSTTP